MGTERSDLRDGDITNIVLGAAMDVHTQLGPGLLESVYRTCLAHELAGRGMQVAAEVPVPLIYKGSHLECAFRADLIVEGRVLVELKAVERLLPVHDAQLLTYLRISGLRVGLLLNFNAISLRHGIRRIVH